MTAGADDDDGSPSSLGPVLRFGGITSTSTFAQPSASHTEPRVTSDEAVDGQRIAPRALLQWIRPRVFQRLRHLPSLGRPSPQRPMRPALRTGISVGRGPSCVLEKYLSATNAPKDRACSLAIPLHLGSPSQDAIGELPTVSNDTKVDQRRCAASFANLSWAYSTSPFRALEFWESGALLDQPGHALNAGGLTTDGLAAFDVRYRDAAWGRRRRQEAP